MHLPAPGEEEKESSNPVMLRCIQLPEPMQLNNGLPLRGSSSFFRDIAVVQGRIKFVDIQIHAIPGSLVPNGWTAVTWSMAVGDPGFVKDDEIHSHDVVNALEPYFFVAHPTLSSQDGDILFLMAKANLDDPQSWVIAVDMKKKKVERKAKFTTQRTSSVHFAYWRTNISSYLTPAEDSKGIMKRRGPVLMGSSRKKPPTTTCMSGHGGDTVEGEAEDSNNLPSTGDDMDME